MIIAEGNLVLAKEQWDKGNTEHTQILKLPTFECAVIKKSTSGEEKYNCNACFDRVNISKSNIYAAKQHFDKNRLIARAVCVERMERHVKTGAGVSS